MLSFRTTVVVIKACLTLLLATTYIKQADARNGGRLFALSYMNLTNSASAFEQIHISSFKSTTLVSISIPQINHYEVISLDSSNNWQYTKNIMQDISTSLETTFSLSMAIIIAAKNNDSRINVHANKAIPDSGAGYLSIALRKRTQPLYEHFVPGCNSTRRSFLSVISVSNDTCVTVEQMNVTTGGTERRLLFHSMKANEVLNMYSTSTDYTGFRVNARKPIAVYGGCDCVSIPDNVNDCDHIMEQVPYVQQLGSNYGTRFVMASVAGRPYNVGFTFRIIAAVSARDVTVRNVIEYTYDTSGATFNFETKKDLLTNHLLYRGGFIELTAGRDKDKFTVVYITCSAQCEVMQYNPSLEVVTPPNPNTQPSDPYMVLVPSERKYTSDITFHTSSVNVGGTVTEARNYITIVSKDATKDILTLDGTSISAIPGFAGWQSHSDMSDGDGGHLHVAAFKDGLKLDDGFHTLTTTTSFPAADPKRYYNAFVYGHGPTGTHTSYGYLAGYDTTAGDVDGPWYDDITSPDAVVTTTAAPESTTADPSDTDAVEDLPIYTLLYVANFTALDPGPQGKTPDYTCSNSYWSQFMWRIGQLTQRINGMRAIDLPGCSSGNIDITVSSRGDIRYFSEYSRSSGQFAVNISGNGSATLTGINTCALELTAYIRDPVNWIKDDDGSYDFTRFLRNNHPVFRNLTGCAPQYLNTLDHKLTLYGSGWVCPVTTGAVTGTAGPHTVFLSPFTTCLAVMAGYIMTLLGRL